MHIPFNPMTYTHSVRDKHLIEGTADDTLHTKKVERKKEGSQEKQEKHQRNPKDEDFNEVMQDIKEQNEDKHSSLSKNEKLTLESFSHTFNPHMDTLSVLKLIQKTHKK